MDTFDKIVDFLCNVARNGILAIFVAFVFWLLLAIVFCFAMIPVAVIVGDDAANSISNFVGGDFGYKVVYAIVFISLMMDDYGVPNVKTAFKKWRRKRMRRGKKKG